ncbi:helix-turn-helix transcriptional regulator [Streptomyces sp. DSM 44915]|uniref:Helix-turn-helix transcriptional regulator n=1 Tax=Streptomyces chisholmiae TaxID=3075540 RepID=A0ABU2JTA0_9ACTN|nr:helix-turn-helix transcriptional regulator [Streptomyces sp. DSM 44915]MDT0267958.1 helix-turn-helix transcriptional regulator [Streptomyces sp. DSM 44915]
MPISSNNPTIRQRRLGRTLRDLRIAAGLKHSDAARVLACAESKMTRLENAQSGIRLVDLRLLLDAYGVTDPEKRAEIEKVSREARQKGWWTRYTNLVDSAYAAYVAVEWDASEIYNVETHLIPGLLQTPDYTKAVIRLQDPESPPEHMEIQLKVCEERRKVLQRAKPLQLWVILSESILYHRVGSPQVVKDQLQFLLEASQETNIELQILPRDNPMNACLFGPFVIMSFPTAIESPVAYTESTAGTVYYEEESDTERYKTLFRRLNVAASDVERSRTLINKALEEMV